jgi:tetratricopeptide (TPR) repeat protein
MNEARDDRPNRAPAREKMRPRFLYPLLTVILAAVAIWGFLWLKNRRPFTPVINPDVACSKPSVAVFDFENKTGRKELDIWSDGLAFLLTTDLSQSKYLRIVAISQIYSPEKIKQLALRGSFNNVVHGCYLQKGKSFIITASLQNAANGDIIDSFKTSGENEESITTSIDEITRKIKLAFPLTVEQLAADVNVGVGRLTTRLPEALKYYLAGRRCHLEREYEKEIEMMSKAIEVDPAFAIAYGALGMVCSNYGNSKKKVEYCKKALQHPDQMLIKERQLILAQLEPNPVKRLSILNGVLNDNPDDDRFSRYRGISYEETGDIKRAVEALKKAYSLSQDAVNNCLNLSEGYLLLNPCDYAAAETVLREFSARHPEWKEIHFWLAVYYTVQRKWDLEEQEIEKYSISNPQDELIFLQRGDAALFQGEWAQAEAEYRKVSKRWRSHLFINLANLYDFRGKTAAAIKNWRQAITNTRKEGDKDVEQELHQGLAWIYFRERKFKEALEEVDRAEQLGTTLQIYLAGAEARLQRALIHTAMGDRLQGENYFSLAAEPLSEEDKQTPIWHYLVCLYRGQMEFVKGNYGQAIESFRHSLSLIPNQHWVHLFDKSNRRSDCLYMIASAHARLGDLQGAIKELEEISTLTQGRMLNPQTLARSYLLAGQLCLKLGQKEKALENFRLFVDIWKDCDPPLRPLVDEARREIKKLGGTNEKIRAAFVRHGTG